METGFHNERAAQRAILEDEGIAQDISAGAELHTDNTKFGQYQLPGGENYREVVLTMPEKTTALPEGAEFVELFDGTWQVIDSRNEDILGSGKTKQEALAASSGKRPDSFTSSHFPDAGNYVAHMRLNDRTDAEGRPGTLLEELQSDRHQQGREKGYAGQPREGWTATKTSAFEGAWLVKNESGESVGTEGGETADEAIQKAANRKAIPDAPFRKDWPLQLFKRALRDAVANGKEWIGWTSGETQAERYDLSKHIDSVAYDEKKGELRAYKGENEVIHQNGVEPKDLEDYIGKEAAKSIMEQKPRIDSMGSTQWLEGQQLSVGGEGMKGFYDNILPKEIGKYVKQWGTSVEKGNLPAHKPTSGNDVIEFAGLTREMWNDLSEPQRREIREDFAKEQSSKEFWKVNITPEMAESVKKGQPLFMPEESPGAGKDLEAIAKKYDGRLNVTANLSKSGNEQIIKLDHIQARKDAPPGTGTDYMRDLVKFADQNGLTIALQTATKGDLGKSDLKTTTSTDRLKKFYGRFGFKSNYGARSYRSDLPGNMHREPGAKSRFMPESASEAGAEERPAAMRKRAAALWKEKGTDSPFFRRWFSDSKVVDDQGQPLRVFSGHSNAPMYGNEYDPRKGTAGGFYATEDPKIASNYAEGKVGGQGEGYEHGSQYRFKLKNGEWGKKIWQVEITPEQVDKMREFLRNEETGISTDLEDYAKKNAPYDAVARRLNYRGLKDIQAVHDVMESLGYTIAYDRERTAANEPRSQLQRKNSFEEMMDHIGLEWNSYNWIIPGVMPLYLRIRNPLDASKPFPTDLMAALEAAAKRTRMTGNPNDEHWTKNYPLKQWVDDIKNGDEYWTTHIPTKAAEIIKSFGYDGIKELGNKNATNRAERQVNWIAFDPEQMKSATGNAGTFDPEKKDMRYMPEDTGKPGESDRPAENLRRDVPTSANKYPSYGNLGDTEKPSELNKTPPRGSEGASKISIPSQLVVARMLASLHDRKILDSVIDRIPVDVVNDLRAKKLSPEMFFHDEAVLKEILRADPENAVIMLHETLGLGSDEAAGHRTKMPFASDKLRWPSSILDSALVANISSHAETLQGIQQKETIKREPESDDGTPEVGSHPAERLAREAEQAGIPLRMDVLRKLMQGDQVAMNAVRRRIEERTGKPARFMPESASEGADFIRREVKAGRLTEAAARSVSSLYKALIAHTGDQKKAIDAYQAVWEELYGAEERPHPIATSGFGSARSEGDIPVERWQNKRNAIWTTPSVFFGPEGSFYADYGDVRVKVAIAKDAKIHKGISSFSYVEKQHPEAMTEKRADVKRITGMDTLQEVNENQGDYEAFTGEVTDNPDYAAFQEVAKSKLQAEGYDGALWADEDQLSPEQYQIWNKDVIRFMPEPERQTPQAREKVISAAVRAPDGKLYFAPIHGMAAEKIPGNERNDQMPQSWWNSDDAQLFVTDKGRIVTRNEASKLKGEQGGMTAEEMALPKGGAVKAAAMERQGKLTDRKEAAATRQRERQHSVQVGDARMTPRAQSDRLKGTAANLGATTPVTPAERREAMQNPAPGESRFMPEDEPSIASLRDEFKRTSLISTGTAKRIMGDKPDYLDAVVDFMAKQRAKTVAGKLTKRDVAKAYILTLSSIGAGGISPEAFTAKTGMKVPKRYLSVEGGKQRIRPEEAAALWMGTPDGKAALDAIEAGNATPDMLESLLTMRDAFGRNDIRNNALRVGGRQRTLAGIAEVTDEINAAKGDVEQIGKALTSLTGIAGGKVGFIKHLLGLGDTSTVDAVELNFWLTGQGSTRQQEGKRETLVRNLKEFGIKNPAISKLVTDRIGAQVTRLAKQYDLDPAVASHIIHHWLWDTAKDAKTTHKGMMEAQARFMPESSPEAPRQRPDPRSEARQRLAARTQPRGRTAKAFMPEDKWDAMAKETGLRVYHKPSKDVPDQYKFATFIDPETGLYVGGHQDKTTAETLKEQLTKERAIFRQIQSQGAKYIQPGDGTLYVKHPKTSELLQIPKDKADNIKPYLDESTKRHDAVADRMTTTPMVTEHIISIPQLGEIRVMSTDTARAKENAEQEPQEISTLGDMISGVVEEHTGKPMKGVGKAKMMWKPPTEEQATIKRTTSPKRPMIVTEPWGYEFDDSDIRGLLMDAFRDGHDAVILISAENVPPEIHKRLENDTFRDDFDLTDYAAKNPAKFKWDDRRNKIFAIEDFTETDAPASMEDLDFADPQAEIDRALDRHKAGEITTEERDATLKKFSFMPEGRPEGDEVHVSIFYDNQEGNETRPLFSLKASSTKEADRRILAALRKLKNTKDVVVEAHEEHQNTFFAASDFLDKPGIYNSLHIWRESVEEQGEIDPEDDDGFDAGRDGKYTSFMPEDADYKKQERPIGSGVWWMGGQAVVAGYTNEGRTILLKDPNSKTGEKVPVSRDSFEEYQIARQNHLKLAKEMEADYDAKNPTSEKYDGPTDSTSYGRGAGWYIALPHGGEIGEGPWDTKGEADDFLHAEVGAPGAKLRKVTSDEADDLQHRLRYTSDTYAFEHSDYKENYEAQAKRPDFKALALKRLQERAR